MHAQPNDRLELVQMNIVPFEGGFQLRGAKLLRRAPETRPLPYRSGGFPLRAHGRVLNVC